MDDDTVEFKRLPVLGEEELAEFEAVAMRGILLAPGIAVRLITALRAKDEEIAALKQERDNWKADYEEMHHSEFGY